MFSQLNSRYFNRRKVFRPFARAEACARASAMVMRAMRYLLLSFAGMFFMVDATYAGEAAKVVFVAGAVRTDAGPLVLDSPVQEGDRIVTGADGYVYLKTIDDGFLILRPNSDAKIVAYSIDTAHPENSRVKLELTSGVARSISGNGVKQSRQNFRFNTPVAAIGVRGTDFTVFTDQSMSRVAVVSGGIVVSGFGGGCRPDGGGPCEGATSRELFANQLGQLLQINKGQVLPQLLRDTPVTPGGVAPARTDEPGGKGASSGGGSNVSLTATDVSVGVERDSAAIKNPEGLGTVVSTNFIQPPPPPPPPPVIPSQVTWGRWQAVLGQDVNVDLSKFENGTARLIAFQAPFALLRQNSGDYQVPREGSMGFALQGAEAYIQNSQLNAIGVATVENGKLNIDFAKANFTTSIDVVTQASQAERFSLHAAGSVTSDGLLFGDGQFSQSSNMNVTGTVGSKGSNTAAYLFNSKLDDSRNVTGITNWTKK